MPKDFNAIADSWGKCPQELRVCISEFWPSNEWANASAVAWLESGFNAFAVDDTTSDEHPCGSFLRLANGVEVSAERSVGYFQINSCNYPDWEWQRLYNARHNAGTAHLLWSTRGWQPWYFSATELGLIS
jgi:hypothetical protein